MTAQKSAKKPVKKSTGKRKDYIVRIHVGDLCNRLVMRVTATSRKEAVEATKAAIEITGETAPIDLSNNTSLESAKMAKCKKCSKTHSGKC